MTLTTIVLALIRRDRRNSQAESVTSSDSEVDIVEALESPGSSVDKKLVA